MARPSSASFTLLLSLLWTAGAGWGPGGDAFASSVPTGRGATLREQAGRSTRVVVAQVLSQRVVRDEESQGGAPRLWTLTRLAVRESLKGEGPVELEVRQLGGESGPWSSSVVGDARFVPGESALAFLSCGAGGDAAACVLVGLGQGKWTVERDVATGRWRARGPEGSGPPRPLEQVIDEIRGMRPALSGTPGEMRPEPASVEASAPAMGTLPKARADRAPPVFPSGTHRKAPPAPPAAPPRPGVVP